MNQVDHAINFAKLSLAGKKRYSGEEFVDHAISTYQILKKYHADETTLKVAILHHCLSDGAATMEDIKTEFGSEIAGMLQILEKLRVIKIGESETSQFAENLRKMFLKMAEDLRIVLIKLADILDNLRTLQFLPKEKQQEVAKETMEIFAPLAERLGIGEMKGEMQDLAFPFFDEEGYLKTKHLLKANLPNATKQLDKIKNKLHMVLVTQKINYRVESRAKHLYSLYTKLSRPEIDFDIKKVFDLVAFRVIVDEVEDCYKVLGVVHQLWKPAPGVPIRDFIANPKPNGYQSIHTTVIGPNQLPFEIQIRTERMHQEAEFGVAAHWQYSEKKAQGYSDERLTKGVKAEGDKLSWVKKLSQWQKEVTENEEFLKSVKTDFFGARIYVFTPKGDVKDLPFGATPVDFAYAIHSELGDKALGAKVNGKMVALDYQLKNGEVVEILLAKDIHKKPSRDWLKFAVTSTAKRKIKRAWL